MRSDARKRLAEATTDALRASLSPHYTQGRREGYDHGALDGYRVGCEDGRHEVIDQLRAIVTRHKPHGTFPAIVAVSDLYTLIGDPTTWHNGGGDAA